jgi:hypothetical protein
MIKQPIILFLPFIFLYGCKVKPLLVKHPIHFESFEITSYDGWIKRFCFRVDSNKIYMIPRSNTMDYGLLPDSIFRMIDTLCYKMSIDSIRSNDIGCYDCSVLYVKMINHDDTLRIKQTNRIDNFLPLIKSLETLIDSGKHKTIHVAPEYIVDEFETFRNLYIRPTERFLEMK